MLHRVPRRCHAQPAALALEGCLVRRAAEDLARKAILDCNKQNYFVTTTAETSHGSVDYFSMEDGELQELTSDILAVVHGCTKSIIKYLEERGLDASKYQSFLQKIDTNLEKKGQSPAMILT